MRFPLPGGNRFIPCSHPGLYTYLLRIWLTRDLVSRHRTWKDVHVRSEKPFPGSFVFWLWNYIVPLRIGASGSRGVVVVDVADLLDELTRTIPGYIVIRSLPFRFRLAELISLIVIKLCIVAFGIENFLPLVFPRTNSFIDILSGSHISKWTKKYLNDKDRMIAIDILQWRYKAYNFRCFCYEINVLWRRFEMHLMLVIPYLLYILLEFRW